MQDMPISPRDIRVMMEDMLETARQLETFRLSIDLTKDKLSILSEARAAGGTELAKAFVASKGPSVLGNFKPSHDLNFRSRSYDYTGLVAILDKTFGSIYKKMGIDFSEISEIMGHYTGEMAGGMSFGKDSFQFEGIDVLKDPKKAGTFIESVYLPWIEKFSQSMVEKLGEFSGEKIENPFMRAKTSTVAGYKVYGAKFKLPDFPNAGTGADFPGSKALQEFEWRFTTVDRYFIYATDDKLLAKMIKKAKTLKPKSVKGPLIAIDLDFGSYLQFIASMVPESAGFDQPVPSLGRVYITYDFKNGKALSASSMKIKDVKRMVAFLSQGAFGSAQADLKFDDDQDGDQKKAASGDKSEEKADDSKEKAKYWFRKGALCATYGNNEAAISYFEKVIALDPEHSGAYFEQGVSYAQLGGLVKI
jgi:tetratricopeptide (TPR) repeat protein